MKRTAIALILVLAVVMSFSNLPLAMADGSTLEPITYTIAGLISTQWNDYPDNAQALYIKDTFGVTFNVIDISDRKEAMMASGDLPDMFIIEAYERQPLIESGFIIPLDDLLEEYGPNIVPDIDGMMDYLRDAMGDGEHIYGLTGFGQPAGAINLNGEPMTQDWGLNVDWERYAALGYPEIDGSWDSYYNLMVDMVNVKPTTDDGLPVYAIAYPTIEMRGRALYAAQPAGEYSFTSYMGVDCWTGELKKYYTDPESSVWQSEYMYWKLNQAGLLDPDSFMMDFDADSLKAVNGQYTATLYHDITGAATTLKATENVAGGFQYIPTPGCCLWAGSDGVYGGRNFRPISANTKSPERLIQVLDWVYSAEGARAIESGFEGQTWNYVDGVPTLTDEAITAYETMNEFYYQSGLGFPWNGNNSINEHKDGYKTCLFNEESYIDLHLTALQKAVKEHYGMSMGSVAQKMYDEGKITCQAIVNMQALNAMPALPDDLQRILNEADAVLNEGMVQCVLAPDEATFIATRDSLIQQVKDMGIEQVEDWFITKYTEACAALEG